MRLNKYMALCGVASRRKSDELIKNKKVKVNGKIIDELGVDIDINKDIVEVDGKKIYLKNKKVYIILNKPEGYVTTVKDQFNRKKVLDLVENIDERIYPIGRLDYETSGLLFLTNDGELTYKLTHPKHEITKTYIAKLKGIPNENKIKEFEKGLKIENYITAPAKFKILKKENGISICEIKIHEGKNRQVRKMCKAIGHPVLSLKRVSMGNIKLGNLKKGEWRYLTEDEIKYLKSL
ncbi:pseudouridine synthase [Tepidibacter thalassicus]|uniref:Pseudouridine synthase n=1 Tax=Tepidibacter thalassicus DSM 15285 TaxID=1123350 RepID=A0A1M5THQ6_9FIRM|nr:pseudouridine synthase [Tepidibacter thalassicus]SHH50208.1 23S rRNA pseudouridine2605 synthase [Tepidibacter thalassicus DSM 15285]